MKLRTLFAVAAISLFAAAPAMAGGSVFAGLSLPMGDFGDFASMGFHGGGYFGTPLGPTATVGVRAAYHRWGMDEDFEALIGGDGESFNMFQVMGFGKVSTETGLFGMGGVGIGSLGTSVEDVDRESKLTFAFGGGYGMQKFELTVLYNVVSTEGTSTNFVTASAGVAF